MPLTPHCDEADWCRRAAVELARLRPELTVAHVAEVVSAHLWEEACDLPPEEAVGEYLREHGE